MFINIKDNHKTIFLQHTLLVLFFAVLYYIAHLYIVYHTHHTSGFEHSSGNSDKLITFFDCVRFSLITQTTVGYGSLIAKHPLTEAINALQLMTIYGVIILSFT